MSRAFHWQPSEAEDMAVEDLLAYFAAAKTMLKAERSRA
jgi:hypothetical protein